MVMTVFLIVRIGTPCEKRIISIRKCSRIAPLANASLVVSIRGSLDRLRRVTHMETYGERQAVALDERGSGGTVQNGGAEFAISGFSNKMKQGGSARKDLASAPAIAPPLHDHREIKRCCKIVLPAIEYPFPAAINAYAEDANQGTIAWAHSYGLMPSDPAGRHRHEEYGYFAARVHPNASRQTLQIAADFIAWLFFADDHNDETETGIRIDWMTERLARFSAVLQGERPARSDSPLCHALFDLRTRASQWVHSSWMTQFKRSMIEYFAAGRWECENRQLGAALSPATYLAMRPFTGAVYPCFDLFAVTDALRLPDAAREHPVVQALRLRANNVISACNDIFSLEKELAHGDMHNLALAILNEQRCSLQQAVERAAAWHDAEVGAYLALERSLPSFGAVVDADLARYAGCLRAWMRGNLDWSRASARYRISASSPDETTAS
jgi:(+)-eremophilene synthase